MISSSQNDDRTSVVALAGRRIDAESAGAQRFPLANVEAVAAALAQTLADLHAIALVSSAACGADLLALKAAQSLSIPAHIVIPYVRDAFKQSSVIDRPAREIWEPLFDDAIGRAAAHGALTNLALKPDDPNAYQAANRAIFDIARRMASERGARPVAIIVWEGAPRPGDDLTARFRQMAEEAGFETKTVPTL
ncbi:hypothetical protein C5688_10750 [Methylocystis sp. MitZ-2018]|nr:hypothetical protein C5688_10750 [Methylocystis sp. MitZ-2018]